MIIRGISIVMSYISMQFGGCFPNKSKHYKSVCHHPFYFTFWITENISNISFWMLTSRNNNRRVSNSGVFFWISPDSFLFTPAAHLSVFVNLVKREAFYFYPCVHRNTIREIL